MSLSCVEMALDRNYINRSEGTNRLVEFCENMADTLNIELIKPPYWVLATKENLPGGDYCKLIIQATTGSAMVSLARDEIENYSNNIGADEVETKIKSKLKTLK